ncbi:hypothetical protein BDW69DRAFT_127520 [Aspergillus filifer]
MAYMTVMSFLDITAIYLFVSLLLIPYSVSRLFSLPLLFSFLFLFSDSFLFGLVLCCSRAELDKYIQ